MFTRKTKNNGVLRIKEIPYELAKKICLEKHYSKKWNATFGVINIGIFKEGVDDCLGVASFGRLMNPNSYKSISENITADQILELNRLWVDDRLIHNAETVFLSLSFKYIKRYYNHIKMIQSFADGRLGCGTIYKAANFNYYGYHKTLFFEDVRDIKKTYHKAPFENTSRLIPMIARNISLAEGSLRAFYVKTYRYIYIIDKRYKKNIKLQEKPYPEYEKGKEYVDNYKQTLSVMARVYMALRLVKDEFQEEKKIIRNYIKDNYGDKSNEDLKEISKSKYMNLVYENPDKYRDYLLKGLRVYIEDVL